MEKPEPEYPRVRGVRAESVVVVQVIVDEGGRVLSATVVIGHPLLRQAAVEASGIDPNRLGLLVAVLGRRAGVGLGSHDVYANLAGGLSVAEPVFEADGSTTTA